MSDDIILAKLAVIRRCLQRIQSKTGGDPETVDDIYIQDNHLSVCFQIWNPRL